MVAVIAGDSARAQLALRPVHPDIGQVWYAARLVLHGQNPYALIGPGRAFQWEAPFFYPLPAAVSLLPLTPFSEEQAVFLFVALGVGLLLWALTAHGWSGLWALASTYVQHAVVLAQWSPLLAGAICVAPISAVLIAKPTIGAAVFAARPSRWALGGAIALILLAYLLQPDWVTEWRHALEAASVGTSGRFPYTAPISQPGGFLVLLAISRWRRPEARLLTVLACVPQTTLPYEGVLLLLVPRGWRQMISLAALSWGASLFVREVYSPTNLTEEIIAYGPTMTLMLYLPCTVMVLRRANQGTMPGWLERRTRTWPTWLRGEPSLADAEGAN
jgi:hypothetical protein